MTTGFAASSTASSSRQLATNPVLSMGDYENVPDKYRTLIPEYVKDYVSLNQFAS